MCLVALAVGQSTRFPLVIATNRDEFLARASAALDWWTPQAGAEPVLGGRDLVGGGTWMGLTAPGRWALLTNVRAPGCNDPQAPTRGGLVTEWLAGSEGADPFCRRIAARGCNGFNLVAGDVLRSKCFWASSATPSAQPIAPGVHGLSNASFDTPWPKVVALKARLASAVAAAVSAEGLAGALFEVLADRTPADASMLPKTGVAPDVELQLSSAFVDMPERAYGTRCSTVLIVEQRESRRSVCMLERTFDAGSTPVRRERHVTLPDWPQAPSARAADPLPLQRTSGHQASR